MGRKKRWPWSLRSTCSSSAQPRVLLVAGEWRVAGLPRGHPGGELLGLAPHQPLSSVAHFISFFFLIVQSSSARRNHSLRQLK